MEQLQERLVDRLRLLETQLFEISKQLGLEAGALAAGKTPISSGEIAMASSPLVNATLDEILATGDPRFAEAFLKGFVEGRTVEINTRNISNPPASQ